VDPITQGALGATAGQILKKHPNIAPISIIAALAGMSPDLDVLIQSTKDPLLFLVFHRQFTHSFFFIPFGAFICSLVLHPLIGKRYSFSYKHTLLLCFVGYASHGLIDACTTYGTLLFWPFSYERIAWNNIAVVDFFYTLPILLALAVGIKLKSPLPARIILFWIFFYPYLGFLQKQKAEQVAYEYLNKQSDINIISLSAKPSMSNIVLWKIVYQSDTHFYVDAVRVGVFENADEAIYFPGDKIEKLNIKRDLPWLDPDSQQALDIKRFAWFSMGYVALDSMDYTNKNLENDVNNAHPRIMDIRYSLVPNQIHPLWSIELNTQAGLSEHVKYQNHRDASAEKRKLFFDMLFPK
jgi:inner membrane protein